MSDGDGRRLGWYRQMLQIGVFDEKVQERFMSGQIEGTTHLCRGQEGVSVGAVADMGPPSPVHYERQGFAPPADAP